MTLTREISVALRMSETDIAKIILTGPRRYKTYKIPKRSGNGERIIAQPARELKSIQRFVVANKLSTLRIHPIATAYKTGASIQLNALAHSQNRIILKLDFKDFFHSIEYLDLAATLNAAELKSIPKSDWPLLEYIFFWRNPASGRRCLSIGAPSSPFLSNVILERMDRAIAAACRAGSVICTRYADDITLSAASIEKVLEAEEKIRKIVAVTKRPSLTFNESKRGLFTTSGKRVVTGLVLTPEGKVSLGRDRKREISAAIHHIHCEKNLEPDHVARTRGWLAYAKGAEPAFFETMLRKYGETVRKIIQMPTSQ